MCVHRVNVSVFMFRIRMLCAMAVKLSGRRSMGIVAMLVWLKV